MKKIILFLALAVFVYVAVLRRIPVSKTKADEAAEKRWSVVCARYSLEPKDYVLSPEVRLGTDGRCYVWTHRERKDEQVIVGIDNDGFAEDWETRDFHQRQALKSKSLTNNASPQTTTAKAAVE